MAGFFRFDTSGDKTVTMKIATSLLGVEQAKRNLELEVSASDTFESVRDRAQQAWDRVLGMVEVEGASEDPAAARAHHLAMIPRGRYGRADEFGRVAALPMSPAAGFLSGVLLPVDGGLSRAL